MEFLALTAYLAMGASATIVTTPNHVLLNLHIQSPRSLSPTARLSGLQPASPTLATYLVLRLLPLSHLSLQFYKHLFLLSGTFPKWQEIAGQEYSVSVSLQCAVILTTSRAGLVSSCWPSVF